MNRINAREVAVQMLFAQSFADDPELLDDADDPYLLDEWLDASFYERMAGEDPLYDSPPGGDAADYIRRLVSGVIEKRQELDEAIKKYAVGWELGRMPRTALAVMRAALYELRYMPDVPVAAAINAHVDIAKRYDSPEVVAFINGILGSYSRAELPLSLRDIPLNPPVGFADVPLGEGDNEGDEIP